MARRKRSTSRVLRDMAADKEKRDAQEQTSRTGEDRTDTRDPQAPAGAGPETPSTGERPGAEAEQDAGRPAAEEKQLESSTEASASIVIPPPAKKAVAICPVCKEKRFDPKLKGKAVKCTNCRRAVVLE